MAAHGSDADARAARVRPRDDSAFDLIDVPAAVVCAACGDPSCAGCAVEEATHQSGVVAIIPWERPGIGLWRRLWQTSTLATVHAPSFFGALPDGDLGTALSFALLCETVAVTGLAIGGALIALLCLPNLAELLWADPTLCAATARATGLGVLILVTVMVGLHAAHGVALDLAARRYGGRRAGSGLRFGLYACGWDLVTLPLGLLATALSSGLRAARRAAPLGLTAPAQASRAYLLGMHGLSPESARLAARRAALLTSIPALIVLGAGAVLLTLALR